ncbi:MAG: hypothetical protein HY698_06625 [Deltaproteobacteria bacterium]|nr:hypothetical protein [Deltaproteobacteria bacterium]
MAALSIPILAAAALAFFAIRRSQAPMPAEQSFALAPKRALEARLSYGPADRYRPYDTARASVASAAQDVPLAVMAHLEAKKDVGALAAAYLLRGEPDHAAGVLEKAPQDPDLDTMRSVVELERGHVEEALVMLDSVLDRAPGHVQARWNRGLALEALGLSTSAASAFEAVAAKEDPGWKVEAIQRASSLRARIQELQQSWHDARQAGESLLARGEPFPLPLARRFPGIVRLFFYDAVRVAPSRESLRFLTPLAGELDAITGGNILSQHLRAAETRDFAGRARLAEEYARMALAASPPSPEALKDFVVRAQRAKAPDLVMGALVQGGEEGGKQYQALAEKTGDPWFLALSAHGRARREIEAGRVNHAEILLLAELENCGKSGIPFRCTMMELTLAELYSSEHRLVEALAAAKRGLQLARGGNEWALETWFIQEMGNIARLRNGLALARAFLDEALERQPEDCSVKNYVHGSLAMIHLWQNRVTSARREASLAPRCGPPLSLHDASPDFRKTET